MAKIKSKKPVGVTAPKAVKKLGRPTIYNEALIDKICQIVATSEKGLHTIADEEWCPCYNTLFRWLNEYPSFSHKYAQAKESQSDFMGLQLLKIADDSIGDETFSPNGNRIENREFTSRSKLRVETRMWLMERLAPRKYGKMIEKEQDKEAKEYQPPQINVTISKEAIDKLNQK